MAQTKNQSHLVVPVLTFYLDDKITVICTWVLFAVVCQIINIFGIVTNLINIVCFLKQGFKDSTNISLIGLSISDLGSLVTLVFTCIFVTPAVAEADLPFESIDVYYLVLVMPHLAFTRVSGCITSLITMERCLSIMSPLKVKRIITPQRTGMCVVGIFVLFTFSATPVYVVNRLGTKFSVARNKTIVGLICTDDKEQVEMYTFCINNSFIPLCSFLIIVVCTAILTTQLHKNSKGRTTAYNDGQGQKVSRRNKKVAKLVVIISGLFIVCFFPTTLIMLAMAFMPEMLITGKYFNVSKILTGCSFILESIHSSVNIFIYHHMSSKYRDTFRTMFILRKAYSTCCS